MMTQMQTTQSNSPVLDFYQLVERRRVEEELAKQAAKKIKKRGRPRTKKYYFDQNAEDAIIAYNFETNQTLRDRVYSEYIYKAFDKLAENIIHTFKFYYIDGSHSDVKHEVVAFLIEKMPKFQKGKGKAFSYFSIVAKNYLIITNNKQYQRLKQKADIFKIDSERNVTNEIVRDEHVTEMKDFITEFVTYWEEYLFTRFNKLRDRQIADAVLELFRIRENIENFNKKALYIMVREMTGVKTLYITKVVNVIKQSYRDLYPIYKKYGSIHRNPPSRDN